MKTALSSPQFVVGLDQLGIEIFSLLLTLKGDKIKFGGLVHINRALILSAILSAVAHLLLLIQFYRES
ncbi:uncharacterized protein LOC119657984 isoform X2 [Hermetia illucens]|uniref:uncharacterized protein LOC119657984 isoform X2 n=1 Tax=Hermetia illucens TaxID=343691 RepID=UPI0018CC0622|nr:uncharacterized protein LOC119657984 isoform X2 [Hermetia illucens]